MGLVEDFRHQGEYCRCQRGGSPLKYDSREAGALRFTHAWQSIADTEIYVASIRDNLWI